MPPRSWLPLLMISALSLAGLAAIPLSGAQAADTPAPAMFTVTVASAFLRSAPSSLEPPTYSVFQGQAFLITGRTADNTWLRVEYPKAKKECWVLAKLGKITGGLGAVPILQGAATAGPPVTPGPVWSATPAPTATPVDLRPAEVCGLIYADQNGNGLLDSNERVLAGARLTVLAAATGSGVAEYTLAAADAAGHCFKDLPAGTYTIAAAPPAGYNLTADNSVVLEARPGEHYELTFGAQAGAGVPLPAVQLDIALVAGGLTLLFLAALVAVGALRLRRR